MDFSYPPDVPLIREHGRKKSGALPAIHGRDRDGMFVEAILVVRDGLVASLDVWRGDRKSFDAPPLDDFSAEPE